MPLGDFFNKKKVIDIEINNAIENTVVTYLKHEHEYELEQYISNKNINNFYNTSDYVYIKKILLVQIFTKLSENRNNTEFDFLLTNNTYFNECSNNQKLKILDELIEILNIENIKNQGDYSNYIIKISL